LAADDFCSGVERIVLSLRAQGVQPPALPQPVIMALHRGPEAKLAALKLTDALRAAGIPASLAFGERSLKSQLKSANKSGVRFAAIIAEDELARGVATLRDMESGEQTEVALEEIGGWVEERLGE
jgi:histidyl-tRNA synthetase